MLLKPWHSSDFHLNSMYSMHNPADGPGTGMIPALSSGRQAIGITKTYPA
jgi:hypothetical protein